MSHRRRHPRACLCPALALALLALPLLALPLRAAHAQAWYQGLGGGLGQWSAEIELRSMFGEQSTSSPTGEDSGNKTKAFGEALRVGNSGFYLLSPLLFTGNLTLDLQLNQDSSNSTSGTSKGAGKTLGYAIDGTFLAEKPYPTTISAQRNQVQSLQSFGGRTVGFTEGRRVAFSLHPDSFLNDLGYPWTEGRLELTQEHNQTTAISFGRSQLTDDRGRTLNLNASKGFESADLVATYQVNERNNGGFAQNNFRSTAALLDYSVDFGPTLNLRLDSKLGYLSRDGQSAATTINHSDHLHVDHAQNLSTDFSYDAVQQSAAGSTSLTQGVSAALAHRLYQNLSSTATVNASQSRLPNGSANAVGTQLGQSYSHSLPGKGTLNLNWSGGYQVNRNLLTSPNVAVFDETHTVPSSLLTRTGFLLTQKFIVADSVHVFNVKKGGRTELLDSSRVSPANADYELQSEGNQLRIVPLSTSMHLAEGDPLLVNYIYQVDPQLESSTRSAGFGAGVAYKWVSASVGHRQSTQTPLNQVTSQFLQSSSQNSAQLGVQGVVLEMAAKANLSVERNKATNADDQQLKFESALAWNPSYDLHVVLDLRAGQGKYILPDQHTVWSLSTQSQFRWPDQTLMVGLSAMRNNYLLPEPHTDATLTLSSALNWEAQSGWTHSVGLDWGRHQDGITPPETLMQIQSQSSITLGKLSLNASVALGQWLRNGSRATNRSLNLSAVRQL